jgi:RNA polymerase sigma-70 factor (ECF subfamily)
MVTDAQVVERLRRHEETAFQALFERLQQPLTGYLHRLVGEREVALDLAQDTFLQVYKEIGRTSGDLKLDAWIYRIATNYGLRYLNRKRLRQFIHLESQEFADDPLATAGLEDQAMTRVLVRQVLSRMNPRDAAIVELHFGNGFTYDEIGEILKVSAEAVRKRVGRSAEKFRALYDDTTATRAGNVETQFVAHQRDGR